jgi:hypothetical protein
MSDEVIPVNGSDRDWTHHRYILWFGAYGWTRLMVWANSLDDALDECVDWIVEHAPGLLADETVQDEYKCELAEAVAEGLDEESAAERAQERAEVDTTCAGNCGHYLNSWEWGILAEDPTRAEILKIQGRKAS